MMRRYRLAAALAVLWVAASFVPASAQWERNGIPVVIADNYQTSAAVCPDDSGRVVVVWMDYRDGTCDIYGNKVDGSGHVMGPQEGIPICVAVADQMTPRLVPDGTGGGIVVWADERDGWRQIFAQRVDGGGNIIWPENGLAVCDSLGQQDDAHVVSDGAGGAIVVWQEWRGTYTQIYAQRFDAGGARLWAENGLLLGVDWNNQYNPRIVPDGAGGAIVGWLDYRDGNGDIYAQRITANGDTLWSAGGVPVCADPGDQSQVFMVPAPGGGAHFIWTDYRYGCSDIFAQSLDGAGLPLWTVGGVNVCPSWSGKYGCGLASDGIGGLYVAWYDDRDGSTYPVFAQHVDFEGNLLWGEYGRLTMSILGGESEIEMMPDGAGGVFLAVDAYADEISPSDIRVQRLDAAGHLLWGADGYAACDEAGNQYGPAMTTDGAGGFFLAWDDYRLSEYGDIYCQRVGSSGLWGDPSPAIRSCLDVPGDQGGWVRIRTASSSHDPSGGIFGYNVWRLIEGGGGPIMTLGEALPRLLDPAKAVGVRLAPKEAAALGLPEGEWESVGFWFATRDTVYNIAVPTKNDSTEAGTAWETFIVTAHTPIPGVFVASEPASGYSVDNLAPGMTGEFVGTESADPAGLVMTWERNAAPDAWRYDVYRGSDEFFVPEPANLIGSTEKLTLLDPTWHHSYMYFFKLVAVDRHGNAGPAALLRPEDINVGMMLQSFAATLRGMFVEVAWTVAATDEAYSFAVSRAVGDGEFAAISSAEISHEGLSFTFVDRGVEPGTTYRYRVSVTDDGGARVLFETGAVSTPEMPLALHQNHPNPFNPSTAISYYLPESAVVTLDVYSADGKLVARLADREAQARGTHTARWSGLDARGSAVSSGVYFYRLQAGKETLSRKMVLMR